MAQPLPVLLAALALAATACTGGSKPEAAPTTTFSTRPTPSLSPCPPKPANKPDWPPDVPDDLPLPKTAKITKTERTAGDLFVMHFEVPWSLREGVVFVVSQYPKNGFVLGRGDAEVTEADAPFQRGELRGLLRIFLTGECKTLWLVALGKAGASVPFNPSFSPRPSGSPLPFG